MRCRYSSCGGRDRGHGRRQHRRSTGHARRARSIGGLDDLAAGTFPAGCHVEGDLMRDALKQVRAAKEAKSSSLLESRGPRMLGGRESRDRDRAAHETAVRVYLRGPPAGRHRRRHPLGSALAIQHAHAESAGRYVVFATRRPARTAAAASQNPRAQYRDVAALTALHAAAIPTLRARLRHVRPSTPA